MKKIIIAIFYLSILSLTYAQSEKADAEYLNILKEYTLNADGSIDFHYTKDLKLLSHFAFHRLYGETFIIYNTDFQTLTINSAYTIMADGKKVVTPENAFNEVLPSFANNAPAFNHIRELVVTHTGLEVGAVICLDYTIHSEKGYFPALMFDEVLNESSPVQKLVVKVNVPATKNLNYKLLNSENAPTISSKNSQQVYTWTFTNIPASSKENHRVQSHLDDLRIMVSSAENMDEMYHSLVTQEAFNLETNTAMNAKVAKLHAENADQLSLALALQKEVSNNLGNLYIPFEFTGFKCRTPIETWNSNQGTGLEKALLLAALLNHANIPAEVVAVIPNALYEPSMGNLLIFNNFAVRFITENYGEIIFSPQQTDKQNLAFSMVDKTILILNKDNKTPEVVATGKTFNKITAEGTLMLKDSALSGQMNVVLESNVNPYFSFIQNADVIKSMVKGGISSGDISSVKNIQLSQNKSHSHLNIEKVEPFEKLNNYRIFEVPYITGGIHDWHFDALTAKRISTIEIPEMIHEKNIYKLTFPDDLKLVKQTENIEIKNETGYLLIKFELDGNVLNIYREIKLTNKRITPDQYTGFKEIMDTWNNPNYRKLIFK